MDADASSPVYGYLKRPSLVDFPGRWSAVFLTSGCNFACGFCHNASLLGRPQKTLNWGVLAKAVSRFQEQWVTGAVISGGEPTLVDGLGELIHFFRDRGLAVKLDTNGSNPELLRECLPHVDYVAMDVKTALSGYVDLTGYHRTERIRESVDLIKEGARDYEFRTTVIEPVHSDEQMHEIGELIQGAKRYVLQPFIPRDDIPSSHLRHAPRTAPSRLGELSKLMSGYANDVAILGK